MAAFASYENILLILKPIWVIFLALDVLCVKLQIFF
jgi:hypothetical protein